MKFKKLTRNLLFLLFAFVLLCSQFSDQKQPTPPHAATGRLAVHLLDVGQGDSIFVELPNGKTMLIDSGLSYHGEDIMTYIQKAGYSRIDYLIASHPHIDHIGSMAYIVRYFPVGCAYLSRAVNNTVIYEDLLNTLKEKNVPIRHGEAGVCVFEEDGLSANILAPVVLDEKSLNNCSIVLRLTYGRHTVLLSGDAEASEMETIRGDIHADVLKVGHHGSRDALTQELIERIQPSVALISCGADNEYKHPHQELLDLLSEAGAAVYRTDTDKTVVVTSDGESLTVDTGKLSMTRSTT